MSSLPKSYYAELLNRSFRLLTAEQKFNLALELEKVFASVASKNNAFKDSKAQLVTSIVTGSDK